MKVTFQGIFGAYLKEENRWDSTSQRYPRFTISGKPNISLFTSFNLLSICENDIVIALYPI